MFARIMGTREFTGWHMAGVMFLFFGTIISVNLVMAYFATSSWSGLVVKNSYVESQRFNGVTAERQAMLDMGWKGEAAYAGGEFSFRLADASGAPIDAQIEAVVGRPSFEREDRKLELAQTGPGLYASATDLVGGIWNADVTATAPDGRVWKHSYRFTVKTN